MNNSAPNRHFIAIASGKGGVGKTWLSITLAQLIARSGRRVLLFDGDIGLANVDVQLGLTPKQDLNKYFSGKCSLKEAVTPATQAGFDVLAGRSGSGVLSNLPMENLRQFARDLFKLGQEYDMVLLDLGAGVESHVMYLARLAAQCLMVLTDEPTSMTDAYAFIKLLRRQQSQARLWVAVNQSKSKREGERTFESLQKACLHFLKCSPELAGVIRRDNKVREAIRHQTPIVIRSPTSMAATDVAALSVKLMV